MLASPAFAADNNLCTARLQELKDKVTSLPATSENTTMEIRRLLASAEASKLAGDNTKCVTEATQALSRADKLSNEPNP